MTSPLLNITQVSPGQSNKETTINSADIALERSINDFLNVDMSAGDVTLSVPEFTRYGVFNCTGLTADRTLTVPNDVGSGAHTAKRLFGVINGDSFDLSLTAGGNTLEIKKKVRAMVSSDGTDLRVVTSGGGAGSGISIGSFIPGVPIENSLVIRYVAVTEFTLPAGLVGSYGSTDNPPVGGSVVFDLSKNGVSFGSMTFADGVGTATFSLASPRNFVPGDIISVATPADLFDISDVSFTLYGE